MRTWSRVRRLAGSTTSSCLIMSLASALTAVHTSSLKSNLPFLWGGSWCRDEGEDEMSEMQLKDAVNCEWKASCLVEALPTHLPNQVATKPQSPT